MHRTRPSTYDVAEQANVSVATVSRVINGRSGVNPQTRALVWKTIRELKYEVVRDPDVLDGIVVLAPTVSFNNTYWQLVASGILDEASRSPMPVMFSSARTSNEAIAQIRSMWPRDGVLGVIKACFPMDYRCHDWVPDGPDIVAVSVLMPSNSHQVNIDMYTASLNATRDLIKLGHARIAFGINSLAWWGQEQRLQGYIDALKEAGIPLADQWVNRKLGFAGAKEWAERLLGEERRPTAIIGGTSELSKHLFSGLHTLKIKIPEEVSFVGFGHLLPFEKLLYNTIAQPTIELGVEAVRVLRRAVVRPSGTAIKNVLKASFIDAGSVGPAPD